MTRSILVAGTTGALLGAALTGVALLLRRETRDEPTVRTVALAAADEVASRATARVTALAASTLAPATGERSNAEAVARLAGAQRAAERCRCQATLPASAFFRLDAATGALDAATLSGPVTPPPLLAELARADAHRPRDPNGPTVHLVSDPRLGDDVLVTLAWYDAPDAARGVVGLVADGRATMRLLFGDRILRPAVVDPATPLVALDSLSLAVTGAGGARLYGALDSARAIRVAVHPRGALDGVTITLAVDAGQVLR